MPGIPGRRPSRSGRDPPPDESRCDSPARSSMPRPATRTAAPRRFRSPARPSSPASGISTLMGDVKPWTGAPGRGGASAPSRATAFSAWRTRDQRVLPNAVGHCPKDNPGPDCQEEKHKKPPPDIVSARDSVRSPCCPCSLWKFPKTVHSNRGLAVVPLLPVHALRWSCPAHAVDSLLRPHSMPYVRRPPAPPIEDSGRATPP